MRNRQGPLSAFKVLIRVGVRERFCARESGSFLPAAVFLPKKEIFDAISEFGVDEGYSEAPEDNRFL